MVAGMYKSVSREEYSRVLAVAMAEGVSIVSGVIYDPDNLPGRTVAVFPPGSFGRDHASVYIWPRTE